MSCTYMYVHSLLLLHVHVCKFGLWYYAVYTCIADNILGADFHGKSENTLVSTMFLAMPLALKASVH